MNTQREFIPKGQPLEKCLDKQSFENLMKVKQALKEISKIVSPIQQK